MSDSQAIEPDVGGAEPAPAPVSSTAEMEFRRYEARLSVWKIVWGTGIVGLAGVLIPGAISLYSALSESYRQAAEREITKQTNHDQYIKDFFDTAINQDIELRIRFAEYFANLSDDDQRPLWVTYRAALMAERDYARTRIGKLEADLVALKTPNPDATQAAKYDEASRELQWAYAEVGYVPINRSVVSAPASKKQALYQETIAILQRLAAASDKLDMESSDYKRFWDLYNRDLIGVESINFEANMVLIGGRLKELALAGTPPTDEFRALVRDIGTLATDELAVDAGAPADSAAQELVRRLWTPPPLPGAH